MVGPPSRGAAGRSKGLAVSSSKNPLTAYTTNQLGYRWPGSSHRYSLLER